MQIRICAAACSAYADPNNLCGEASFSPETKKLILYLGALGEWSQWRNRLARAACP